jgi:hypothetical protein
MIVELFVSKSRIPYIIEEMGADRVIVEKLNDSSDQDLIKFEISNPIDLLHIFHAGIRYGSDSMAKTLIK